MVVNAHYSNIITGRNNRSNWWWLCNCTVYLYVILVKTWGKFRIIQVLRSPNQKNYITCSIAENTSDSDNLINLPYTKINNKNMKNEKVKALEAQLAIVVGFGLIAYYSKNTYFLQGVLLLGLAFLLFPSLGNLVAKGWFKLAELIGGVMSKVLLSVVFFVFLLPVASLAKLFNRNLLGLKDPGTSNYTERNQKYSSKDLEHIW